MLMKNGDLETGTIIVILPDRVDRCLNTNLPLSSCADCPP